MSTGTTKSPNLPLAPVEYNARYMDQLTNVLRLYFATLDNAGPSVMSTERAGGRVVAALNFSRHDTQANAQVLSLPDQTELSSLRTGDVYVDTSAGHVLKVKP
jgi:hypothetical protein